jgi:threonine dehydrogenase-like Zn-dependent dehydrogenase
MKANCWVKPNTVRVENVPDPTILNRRDAIVKITSTSICGSDLHLLDGYVPTMQKGDVMGHEFMGEVIEVGDGVDPERLRVGDRVVVPFPIACGACMACRAELYSCCENTNPNAGLAEKMFGHPTAGIFGYSHLTGGFAGGQAEYVRVPFADTSTYPVPEGTSDEQLLMLADILPTGYEVGVLNGNVRPGDVVAVVGAGPIGLSAIMGARLFSPSHVVAVDLADSRLEAAKQFGADVVVNNSSQDPLDAIGSLTGGLNR